MWDHMLGGAAIAAACAVVLIMGVVRSRMEWLLNVLTRGVLGAVAIYFINQALALSGISLGVGLNPVTVLTSGILGLPGLAAIYAIGFYQFL